MRSGASLSGMAGSCSGGWAGGRGARRVGGRRRGYNPESAPKISLSTGALNVARGSAPMRPARPAPRGQSSDEEGGGAAWLEDLGVADPDRREAIDECVRVAEAIAHPVRRPLVS